MADTSKSYERGQVIEIIQSVIDKMDHGTAEQQLEVLKAEVASLASVIEAMRAEIASTSPHNVGGEHVPDATDELDAVIEATADATNKIMSSCEAIQEVAGSLDDDKNNDITNHIMNIYEACGFQDITGQRISKVVSTLVEIETKVGAIISALDLQLGPIDESGETSRTEASVDDPESLLNGPQMVDKAVNQDDIDKLLAEFD